MVREGPPGSAVVPTRRTSTVKARKSGGCVRRNNYECQTAKRQDDTTISTRNHRTLSLQCKYVGRTEKINITIPGYILAKVDDYAKSLGLTRSGFLVQATERAIR
ncbi:type II toxin-antitoxin system HicB family antitoxin [Aliidongia dinghuensis]|uniref:type II toxin-antitoxin system HicB family antitoxin n=1 Tax=Aliidongia dinghuensis TaxID=1867774 RepID=UPI00389921C4